MIYGKTNPSFNMTPDEKDEYLQGTADATDRAESPPVPSAQMNLDAELTPSPRRASAVRLALYAGLALCPVIPAILIGVAFLSADGDFGSGIFSVAMIVMSLVAGLLGFLILAVAGFLMLIYRGADRAETEVFGSAAPNYDRGVAAENLTAALDLRLGWGPALLYLVFFAGAQFARPLWPGTEGVNAGIVELIGGILNVLALMLFCYFWVVGYVRQNRAGLRISQNFYLAALAALAAFFLPVILI